MNPNSYDTNVNNTIESKMKLYEMFAHKHQLSSSTSSLSQQQQPHHHNQQNPTTPFAPATTTTTATPPLRQQHMYQSTSTPSSVPPPPNLPLFPTGLGHGSSTSLFNLSQTSTGTSTGSTTNTTNNDLFASKIEHMLFELHRLLLTTENQLLLLVPRSPQQQPMSLFQLLPPNHDIILVMRQIPLLINQSGQPQLLRFVIERVINQLYSVSTSTNGTAITTTTSGTDRKHHVLSIEVYCRFLKILLELSPVLAKETENWFVYYEDERKNNALVTAFLIQYGLLPLEQLDVKLAKDVKENKQIDFIVELLRHVLSPERKITTMEEHVLTIHALMDFQQQHEKAKVFLDDLKQQFTDQYHNEEAFRFRLMFAEWLRVCRVTSTPSIMYKQFAKRIITTVLANESESDRQNRVCCFFRLCTEASIELYEQQQQPSSLLTTLHAGRAMTSPQFIDAYTKLVGIWVRSITSDGLGKQQQSTKKLKLISNILSILVLVLAHRHEQQQLQFNQKPFLKLFSSIFIEFLTATQHSKLEQMQFITLYSNVLYTLQPIQFPGFAFSWLQLFSHRFYLPLLFSLDNSSNSKIGFNGKRMCYKLMVAHLRLFRHLLRTHHKQHQQPISPLSKSPHQLMMSRFTQPEKAFYQGTLRFLVVILHDYPEFLCQHYFSLIRLLPLECIQLRNVILSAFPRTMILPNPFTTSIEYMKNMSTSNSTQLPATSAAMNEQYFDKDIDALLYEEDVQEDAEHEDIVVDSDDEHGIYDVLRDYLTGQSTTRKSIGKQIMNYLTTPPITTTIETTKQQQNTVHPAKLQKLIFFVGIHAPPLDTSKQPLSENLAIQIYKYILLQLQPNSYHCYLMINYLIDHLRYPADTQDEEDTTSMQSNNSLATMEATTTYFFSITLLHLFSTGSSEVKEWITRVLLERLIVNRPHPWGLLTTFIQLIKEPMFLENEFIKRSIASSADIKRLFENVLKSTRHY